MNRSKLPSSARAAALGAAALLATAGASAQVYKIVAPDGHVVYSDQKPPAEAQDHATVIGSAGSRRPLVAPAAAPSGPPKLYLPPPQPGDGAAKQAIAASGRGGATRDLQLVEGLVVARGYQLLVQGFVDTCAALMPSSLGRFNAAAHAWSQANALPLSQAAKLRANLFSPPQQAAIEAIAQSRADVILAPARAASPEPRIQWCDSATDLLHSPLLGLATKAAIAQGFAPYVVP